MERKKKFTVGFSLRQQVSNSKLEYLLKIPEEKLLQELEEYCRMVPFPIEDLRKEKTFEKLCRHLDGLLVCAGTYPVSEISGFRDLRIPCVLIQGDFEYDLPLHQVIPAHWTGLQEMFAAAEEWKLNGVVILYPDHQNGRARKDACVRAAEEFGYAKIETVNAGYGAINYYRIGLEIASRCRRCLVFTCTDLATFELYRAFQDKKMRPSEDFHLVGYDNVEGYGLSPFPEPVATAIEMDRYTITKKAAEILLSELNHPSGVYHTIRVPTHLVIRKSAFRKEKIYAPAH